MERNISIPVVFLPRLDHCVSYCSSLLIEAGLAVLLIVVLFAVVSGERCRRQAVNTSRRCRRSYLCSVVCCHWCQTWSTTARTSGNSHLSAFLPVGLAWLWSGNSHPIALLCSIAVLTCRYCDAQCSWCCWLVGWLVGNTYVLWPNLQPVSYIENNRTRC